MKTILKIGIAVLAIFLLLGCIGSNGNTDNTATQSDNVQSTQSEKTTSNEDTNVQESVKEAPVTIASWEGESTKNTETFHVPSKEWKISWDTTSGKYGDMNFQIYVYDSNGRPRGVAANVVGANNDSTIMRGEGDYYLMVNTAQPYKITVETM